MTEIPALFFETFYEGEQYPGVAQGLDGGANCQHFCHEIIRHYGFEIEPLRSSDLWHDTYYTQAVGIPQFLDLALFNRSPDSFGAHVGIWIGDDRILHSPKKIGKPVIWPTREFSHREEYGVLIGFKGPINR